MNTILLLLLNFVVQRADLNEIRSLLNRTVNKVCSFIKTRLPQYSNHLIEKKFILLYVSFLCCLGESDDHSTIGTEKDGAHKV